MEDNMGTQYFEVDYMVVGNMVEDGMEEFDWNQPLDSLAVWVFGNMNYTADGSMVGVDTECYAVRRIQWMVEGNMDDVGSLGEGYCP